MLEPWGWVWERIPCGNHSKEGSRLKGFVPKFWAGLGGAKGMDLIHSYVLEGIIKGIEVQARVCF